MNDILKDMQYLIPTFFVDRREQFHSMEAMQDAVYLRKRADHYDKLAGECRAMADRLEMLGKEEIESVVFDFEEVGPGGQTPFHFLPGVAQIEEAIKAHGRKPTKRADLWRWMQQKGTKLKVSTFRSYLSQDSKFKRLGWDQWVLTEDFPSAPGAPAHARVTTP